MSFSIANGKISNSSIRGEQHYNGPPQWFGKFRIFIFLSKYKKKQTHFRDEKVKAKIIRIFNIWEQRGIYNEEFLSDLHDLLSINPTKKQQPVESDDEHVTVLSSNVRSCVRIEKDTDKSFKLLSKSQLSIDPDQIHTLKDRRHVEDVERENEDHMHRLENYLRSLHTEIKARTILIAVLEQTDAFYHNQRGEVKVVANVSINDIVVFVSI